MLPCNNFKSIKTAKNKLVCGKILTETKPIITYSLNFGSELSDIKGEQII